MLKLLLLDHDREFMDGMIKYANSTGKYTIVGAASDGETALELLQSNKVDIAIVELDMPNQDGMYVLGQAAFAPGHKPVFIALQSKRKISEKKATYLLSKPVSAEQLSNSIDKIWEAKTKKTPSRKRLEPIEFGVDMTPFPLLKRPVKMQPEPYIRDLLHKIGAPFHLRGSTYLQSAFLMVVEEGEYKTGDLMNRIYPTVAKLHNTTPFQVERGIRYMAIRTMKKGRDLIITNHLGIPMMQPGKRLTNGELLSALVYCYHRDNGQA